MKRFIILASILIFPLNVVAGFPSTKIKFHNSDVKKKKRRELADLWLNFLNQEPDTLKAIGKDYKEDQFCSFSLEINGDGSVNLESIELTDNKKNKKNFKYNLRAIEFLRQNPLELYKEKEDQPIIVEFKYLSF